ncbi:MAG TPA: hypothetical protein PLO52_00475 [Flavobacterium alvei]|nr:hypothetical protein [Flavobacterium alvei]
MSENQLVKAAIKYLNAIGHLAYRTHNYPVYDEKLQLWRKPRDHRKGIPDIHICLRGGGYAVIETKWSGKQSIDQKLFQKDVERVGGTYLVAYNIDTIMKAFPSKPYSGSLHI